MSQSDHHDPGTAGAGSTLTAGPVGLTDRIDRAILHHPDNEAVRTAGSTTTYREFGELVDGFVDDLTEHTRVDEFVGVEADRGLAALVAMIGSLKAGRPFVVLDPGDSDTTNAAKVALLSLNVVARTAGGRTAPELGDVPTAWAGDRGPGPVHGPRAENDRLAYAVYTSGSTGEPKCVLVRAEPLDAVIADHVRRLEVDSGSRTLRFARLTFDGCITEILWTLTAGGCLIALNEDLLVPGPVLQATLEDFGVTHFKSTPFALTATEVTGRNRLRHVVNGGGTCRPATAARWAGVARFHNAYGTTETTVCNLLSDPLTADDCRDGVPLGSPVGDCGYHLAEPSARGGPAPAALGRGELVITGESVADGYLAVDGLRRFDGEAGRSYHTGDLVETREGRLYFVERLDRQVKVRGFRLDPGEIENAVCRHPSVDEAVVVVGSHDGGADADALICYYQGPPDSRAVREHLENLLDPYKIPSVITSVGAFPYTPNGKVDRAALQADRHRAPGTDDAREGRPQDRVLTLVRRLTGVDDAGPDDNFFDIGGDSASAVVLTNSLKEWGWRDVGVRDVLRADNLGSLADRLHERSA